MTTQLVVVEDLGDWKFEGIECTVIHVDDYLTGQEYFKQRNIQVVNLCRGYRYLSVGYYCSLLAEARRHRVIPSVKSILDLSSRQLYSLDTESLDERVEKVLKRFKERPEGAFELDVFFGHCRYEALGGLARQIFEAFPCPLLRVSFQRQGTWRLGTIRALALNRLRKPERELFAQAFAAYQKRRWRPRKSPVPARYDLAILHNPADPLPPSSNRALQQFIKAGRAVGIDVDLIEKRDYSRLAEYDALFIRDTTRINHYTYRFAKRAESEGMVVIDDPQSILRCTNKVYLAELLRANRVPTPKTVIAGRHDMAAVEEAIGYPMVLKVPDGSFSQGVVKAEDAQEMKQKSELLFATSELILAQEFLYTEFDWRIGILNREPIFACQYFMSKRHWQIVHYDGEGRFTEGAFKSWPLEEVPPRVIEVALKAANLIGDGLYGVDLKQSGRGVFVIEVNDNPNIDAGVEDGVLRERLYRRVMEEFVRRLELRRREAGGAAAPGRRARAVNNEVANDVQ